MAWVATGLITGLLLIFNRVNGLRGDVVRSGIWHHAARLNLPQRTAAMLAVFSFAWPTYVYFRPPIGPSVNPYTLLALATVLISAPRLLKTINRLAQPRHRGPVDVFTVLAAVMVLWKLAISFIQYTGSNAGFVDVLTTALPLFLICTARVYAPSLRSLQNLVLAIAVLVVSFGAADLALQSVAIEPLAVAGSQAGDVSELVAQLASAKERGSGLRLQSVMTHPIVLGEFCAMFIPILWAIALCGRKAGQRKLATTVLAIALTVIALGTDSRSALVVGPLALALFMTLYQSGKFSSPRQMFVAICLIVGATVGLLVADVLGTVVAGRSDIEASSSASRVLMLAIGWDKLLDSPLLGYGPGMASSTVGVSGAGGVYTLDNLFLVLALQWGTPLAILQYLFFGILFLKNLGLSLRSSRSREQRALTSAAAGCLLCYLVFSLVLGIDDLQLFVAWFGLLAISYAQFQQAEQNPYRAGS